jgi:8-oxo-dGTP diphosphatase
MTTQSQHHERPIQVPNVATDAIVVRPSASSGSGHEILLITRLRDPFMGALAFPGGFVDYNEDPEVGCLRELEEECGIKGKGIELVTVAGNPERDPRKHIISIVYQVLIDETSGEAKAGDDAASAKWYDI